jgi:anaerobic selenocysteine-containing dehydrogenase
MYDSDCIVVMGSNMAENHPVAFRWPMKAKVEHGAKIIHIDPRFTRTSAVADIYAPVRAGSDIAFLGGVINYVINSERWNKDPFFKTFVVNYTNAATLLREDFQDTEDLDGVFSGLETAKGGGVRVQDFPVEGVAEWPFNGFINQYHRARGVREGEAACGQCKARGTQAWRGIRAAGCVSRMAAALEG